MAVYLFIAFATFLFSCTSAPTVTPAYCAKYGQVVVDCIDFCERTCNEPQSGGCFNPCWRGCGCPAETIFDDQVDYCVPFDNCTEISTGSFLNCPGNMVPVACGDHCYPTCDQPVRSGGCTDPCKPACECSHSLLWDTWVHACVRRQDCSSRTTAPPLLATTQLATTTSTHSSTGLSVFQSGTSSSVDQYDVTISPSTSISTTRVVATVDTLGLTAVSSATTTGTTTTARLQTNQPPTMNTATKIVTTSRQYQFWSPVSALEVNSTKSLGTAAATISRVIAQTPTIQVQPNSQLPATSSLVQVPTKEMQAIPSTTTETNAKTSSYIPDTAEVQPSCSPTISPSTSISTTRVMTTVDTLGLTVRVAISAATTTGTTTTARLQTNQPPTMSNATEIVTTSRQYQFWPPVSALEVNSTKSLGTAAATISTVIAQTPTIRVQPTSQLPATSSLVQVPTKEMQANPSTPTETNAKTSSYVPDTAEVQPSSSPTAAVETRSRTGRTTAAPSTLIPVPSALIPTTVEARVRYPTPSTVEEKATSTSAEMTTIQVTFDTHRPERNSSTSTISTLYQAATTTSALIPTTVEARVRYPPPSTAEERAASTSAEMTTIQVTFDTHRPERNSSTSTISTLYQAATTTSALIPTTVEARVRYPPPSTAEERATSTSAEMTTIQVTFDTHRPERNSSTSTISTLYQAATTTSALIPTTVEARVRYPPPSTAEERAASTSAEMTTIQVTFDTHRPERNSSTPTISMLYQTATTTRSTYTNPTTFQVPFKSMIVINLEEQYKSFNVEDFETFMSRTLKVAITVYHYSSTVSKSSQGRKPLINRVSVDFYAVDGDRQVPQAKLSKLTEQHKDTIRAKYGDFEQHLYVPPARASSPYLTTSPSGRDKASTGGGLGLGVMVGIVVGAVILSALIISAVCLKIRARGRYKIMNNHVDFGMATFDTRMDLELKGHSSDLVDDFDFVE